MVGDRQDVGRESGLKDPRMDTAVDTTRRTGWQHDLYDLLRRHDITQFAYVPDAGHSILIDRSLADPGVHSIPLTTEEEGVALIAGADLGGARAVLLMQSSGVGNCINMFSLLPNCGFPCLVLVTMRGEFADFNPWQVPMGSITEQVLKLCGFLTYRVEQAQDVDPVVGSACDMAFNGNLRIAILLAQRLVGHRR